jgi:hypothetical protein
MVSCVPTVGKCSFFLLLCSDLLVT